MEELAFRLGERVRISEDWFISSLKGATGHVALPPPGIDDERSEGVFWVQLDEAVADSDEEGAADGAEVDVQFLQRL